MELVDFRQTGKYAIYLEKIGWKTGKISGNYYFSKKLPILGSLIKIQRFKNQIPIDELLQLATNERAIEIALEPLKIDHFNYYISEGKYKISKSTNLPSKTIEFDLKKTESKLLAEMHAKTRYNITLAKKRGVNIERSNDIETYVNFWQRCAYQRGFFLPLKKEIKELFFTFGDDAYLLFAFKSKELVAAVFSLEAQRKAYYMYAASTPLGKSNFAPNLLVWESMLMAKRNNCLIYDFEGIYDERFPLPSWMGFTRFKKGFGGSEIYYPGKLTRYFLPL